MTVLDQPQHLEALAQANEVRFAIARIRQSIRQVSHKGGVEIAARILEDRELLAGPAGSMPVGALLGAVRGVGLVRRRWFAMEAGVGLDQRLRSLNSRQRGVLVGQLRGDV